MQRNDASRTSQQQRSDGSRLRNRSTTLAWENPWPATSHRSLSERLCDGLEQMEKEDHFDLPDRADNE